MLITFAILAAALTAVHGASDATMLEEFCVDILLQSEADASQCYEKPYSYSMEQYDNAILAYLCCLGLFNDVTQNYMQYLSGDMVQHIAEVTTEKNVVDIAKFVMMCKSTTASGPLKKVDYLSWLSRGKTLLTCRAN